VLPNDVAKYYESDIKRYVEVDMPKYESELVSLEKRKLGLKESIFTEEKFLKLVADLVNYIGDLQDLAQLDEILSKFYSNFVILNKSVSVITFNEEWYNVLNPAWLEIRDSNSITLRRSTYLYQPRPAV
jgi:hypothetical protein